MLFGFEDEEPPQIKIYWRVLICGGRDFGQTFDQKKSVYDLVEKLVLAAKAAGKELLLIHGGARGADSLVEQASIFFSVKTLVFHADWDKHKKAAGQIRNKQMLKEGNPELVLAFPGGVGTENMCKIASKANIPVRRVQ